MKKQDKRAAMSAFNFIHTDCDWEVIINKNGKRVYYESRHSEYKYAENNKVWIGSYGKEEESAKEWNLISALVKRIGDGIKYEKRLSTHPLVQNLLVQRGFKDTNLGISHHVFLKHGNYYLTFDTNEDIIQNAALYLESEYVEYDPLFPLKIKDLNHLHEVLNSSFLLKRANNDLRKKHEPFIDLYLNRQAEVRIDFEDYNDWGRKKTSYIPREYIIEAVMEHGHPYLPKEMPDFFERRSQDHSTYRIPIYANEKYLGEIHRWYDDESKRIRMEIKDMKDENIYEMENALNTIHWLPYSLRFEFIQAIKSKLEDKNAPPK